MKEIAIQPKYLQKVESKIKDMVKHDKMKSKESEQKYQSNKKEVSSSKKENRTGNVERN